MRSIMITLVLLFIFAANTVFLNAAVENDNKDRQTLLVRMSRDLSDSSDLVPLKNIGGTKLYSGIYYKVGMKVFTQGWITWTYNNNYIEVDSDPSQLPKYESGEPYEHDNQWFFGTTESDLGYTLTNRGKPLGFLIWVNAGAGTGYHIRIYDDPVSIGKMSVGGEWRNDALWIPQSTNDENYYKLENLANRGSFLTWTYKKHNEFNYYLQMASYDAKEDSKFSFQPAGIKLEAKVYDLKFAENICDILKRDRDLQINKLAEKKHFPNFSGEEITSTVEESTQTTETITFVFKESFKMMRRTRVDAWDKEFSFEGGFEADKGKTTENAKSLSLTSEIRIPAYTDIEASIYTVMANVEVAFTAKMEVVGFAERMVVNRPGETREGNVPADVVEHFINSSAGSKMEILTRSDDSLIVQVSGIFKGNLALNTVMNTTEVKIWTIPSTQTETILH